MKDGYRTTEFYVAVLTGLGSLVAALAGALPARYAALAASVSSAAYALARGLAKLHVPTPAPIVLPPVTSIPTTVTLSSAPPTPETPSA